MAVTPIYQKNLEAFYEADQNTDPDTAPTYVYYDRSGKGRDLVNTGSPYPTAKYNAVPVSNKKSVLFNGSAKPLQYSGAVNIKCGFMVAKTSALPSVFGGLLTSITNTAILVTNQATNNFYDFLYNWYEYRLNDYIRNPVRQWVNGDYQKIHTPPAPAGGFGIIFFRFWDGLTVNSLQIGQDRTDASRKLNAEVPLLALYSDDMSEEKIRKMHRSISFNYKIGIADKFPFAGSRGDVRNISREVLTDGQKEPHIRVRDSRTFNNFEANFGTRTMDELKRARAFYNSFYPDKNFLFTDYNTIPPEDILCRYAIPTDLALAESLNQSGYQLNFSESLGVLNYTIPTAQPDMSE